MCKAVADRMLHHVQGMDSQYPQWVMFYYQQAAIYFDQALDSERTGLPAEHRDEFLDYAIGCELAANILFSRLYKH